MFPMVVKVQLREEAREDLDGVRLLGFRCNRIFNNDVEKVRNDGPGERERLWERMYSRTSCSSSPRGASASDLSSLRNAWYLLEARPRTASIPFRCIGRCLRSGGSSWQQFTRNYLNSMLALCNASLGTGSTARVPWNSNFNQAR